jgi:hypothetical protein
MDLYTASVYELRGELRKLKRTFDAIPVSAMKRKDILQHIEIYRKMVAMLDTEPKIDAGSGKLPPRPIPTNTIELDDTPIIVPKAPEPRAFAKHKKTLQE